MTAIELKLGRGPYQDDGASPWYGLIEVGGQPTQMKLALDTGTNMNWVTSTQCNTPACTMPGRVRFDPNTSSTFQWVDETNHLTLNYGPWGKLTANLGKDYLNMPAFNGLGPVAFGLAINYEGEKFEEVDWDGCLAMPSQAPMQYGMSFLFQDLRQAGLLSETETFFSYATDPATEPGTATGTCILGGFDPSKADLSSMLILPFSAYAAAVDYIWSTPLQSATFGGAPIAQGATFCLDTGSSRFKGDGVYMNAILQLAANVPTAELELEVGFGEGGACGKLVLPPDIYNQKIEKGTNAGKTMPQFHELAGVPGLFLAGSILMDHLYTVYVYTEVSDGAGGQVLKPAGMAIFNRNGGAKIIQNGMPFKGDEADIGRTLTAAFAQMEGQ